jgi:ADP-heptose:LPS heptosyltransferase
MHIASGLGKTVIALFPPIPSQSPVKWGPLGEKNVVLMPEVECRQKRCNSRCKLYNCMERITPERVLEEVCF